MKHKLYANIRRMTNMFCVGILSVTLSVLALRLTAFSDMATAVPQQVASNIITNEAGGYALNGKIHFTSADAKGDVFITNLEDNPYIIKVNISLADTEESILYTGFINPGVSTDSAKLNHAGQRLGDGTYACVAEITTHDPDSLKAVDSTTEQVQIHIGAELEDPGQESEDESGKDSRRSSRSSDEASDTEPSDTDPDAEADPDTEPAD